MLMLQQELKHQLDLIPVTTKTVIKILKIDESISVLLVNPSQGNYTMTPQTGKTDAYDRISITVYVVLGSK